MPQKKQRQQGGGWALSVCCFCARVCAIMSHALCSGGTWHIQLSTQHIKPWFLHVACVRCISLISSTLSSIFLRLISNRLTQLYLTQQDLNSYLSFDVVGAASISSTSNQ